MREFNEKKYKLLNPQVCAMHLKHHAEQSQESDELRAGAWWQSLKHDYETTLLTNIDSWCKVNNKKIKKKRKEASLVQIIAY